VITLEISDMDDQSFALFLDRWALTPDEYTAEEIDNLCEVYLGSTRSQRKLFSLIVGPPTRRA